LIMITLKEWMELVEFKITEGSDYNLYSHNAYALSSWNGDQDGHSFNIVFDPTDNQKVYAVEACDFKNKRAYRLKDPTIDVDNQAWDECDFVDLESDDDFMQKAIAIRDGEDYDTRVVIPLDLSEKDCYNLMKMAHERDMTLNDFVATIIEEAVGVKR
jgi:hypothetical protein